MNLLFSIMCGGIAGFLKFFTVCMTLRIYLTWLPNINFFQQPFYSLAKMTDPYLRLFRGIVPPLLSFDISPLLGFIFLSFLVDFFESLVNVASIAS